MKKQIFVVSLVILLAILQACGDSSSPAPATPATLIKGKWVEFKTTSSGRVTKGLPFAAMLLFPNGQLPASFFDTLKIVREMNFTTDKDVVVLTGTTQPATSANWKFTNGTSSLEFSNLKFPNPLLNSLTTLNADIKKLTATEFTIASTIKLTNVEFDATSFQLGKLKLDVELVSTIEMKK
jgi:hypothetical protein